MAATIVTDRSDLREEGLFWFQISEISVHAYGEGVVVFLVMSILQQLLIADQEEDRSLN